MNLKQFKKLFSTGFFHIFGGNLINKMLLFINNIIFVRMLTKPEYGVFTYAWNIYSFIVIFNGFGLCSGALQVSSEKSDKEKSLAIFRYALNKGFIYNLFLTILLILMAMLFPVTIESSRELLCLLIFLPNLQYVFDLQMIFLRVNRENQKYAVFSVMNTVFILLFSIIGAFLLREKGLIIGRYAGYSLSIVIYGSFFYQVFKNNFDILTISDKQSINKISFVSMLNNGISQLLYLFDIFVIGIVVANENVLASYKVATMIPTALIFIPIALVTYLYPYFASHIDDKEWCFRHYKKIFFYNLLFNGIIALVLFVLAPKIIKIIFGLQYLDAVAIFRILIVSYFFSSSFRVLSSNLLVAQRKLKFNFFESVICGGVNVLADYLLIKLWGGIGAAIATLIVVIISSLLSTSFLIYTYKKSS